MLKKARANWQDPRAIERAAIDLLARREHSRYELQQKLAKKGIAAASLTIILDKLVAENLLSDERFAEAYVRYRSGQGYGPLRIRQELITRGVEKSIIDAVLDKTPSVWIALAAKVRVKKFGSTFPHDLAEKAKQVRFLLYRGFSFEHID